MLYEVLSQPITILSLLLTGMACGILFDAAHLILAFCNKNKVLRQILYFICTILSAFFVFYINLIVNYGRFRIYVLLVFSIGFALQKFTLGKLFTRFINLCYNKTKERQTGGRQKEKV